VQHAVHARVISYPVHGSASPQLLQSDLMKFFYLLLFALSLSVISCQSASRVVQHDADLRTDLFAQVSALEGRWQGEAAEGPMQVTEFSVTSGGSVVREIMMPGEPYEMTNMYSLDGNSLLMTHYCAIGNQPRMRATSSTDGRMVFESEGVSDLKSSDDLYMGSMTLVIKDADHAEQHWTSFKNGEVDSEMIIKLTRVQ